MASAEVWILNLLGAVSYVAGAYVAVKYVLPLVKDLLGDVVKYGKGVNAFVKLLEIAVYVTAATGIVGRLILIGEVVTGYAGLAAPALEVVNTLLFPTVKMLVIGIGILLVVERIKLK
jgi:hypothetical protein